MKAAVYERYGAPEVIQIRDVPTPVPAEDEVLIRTRATTVSTADWRGRTLKVPTGFGPMARLFFGITKPRQPILGSELSGVVEAVGKDVTKFTPGEDVFAFADMSLGCHAEFRAIKQDGNIAPKPTNLSFEEAAALCFGGTTALNYLRKAELKPVEKLLVNGAAGSVGSALVQLGRHFGAEVTGVCSTDNVEVVRTIGAHHVIDYKKEDVTGGSGRYDVIADTVGNFGYDQWSPVLKDGGRVAFIVASLLETLKAPFVAMGGKHTVIAGPAVGTPEDIALLGELAATGKYRPVVGHIFPFQQIREAHRLVETGHKRGNAVVTLP